MGDMNRAKRLKAHSASIERLQLEAEAALPPLSTTTFRERREEAVFDGLLFAVSCIARSEGQWRYELNDEDLHNIVGHLLDAMSVVRRLPVVSDPEHRAKVDQVRRHMTAVADADFQRFLSGIRR